MLKSIVWLLCCGGMAGVVSASHEVPGAAQAQPIALLGGTIHPVSSKPIENGVLVFKGGRITAVGRARDVKLPEECEKIEIKDQHVYPGLFEAHSIIGLTEISSVRGPRDTNETGAFNPNVKAYVAVNPDSEIIPVTRANGVLLAVSAPLGGVISGQAAVLQMDGWTYEQMTVSPVAGLVVNWPSVPKTLKDGGVSKQLLQLEEWFDNARVYQQARAANASQQRTDLKLESMIPVLERQVPLLVWADRLAEIQSAVAFASKQDLKLVIYGGYDAPLCADLLKQHDVPVVVSAVYRLPMRQDDGFDAPFTLPLRLHQAGVKFCISGTDSARSTNIRNLPYNAATAIAYGLPADEALRAITLSPAEILGVADQVGSLEAGKDATLIVTTGDPLETATTIQHAWIQGRSVDLSSRHTRLNEKYREKYKQLQQ